jgi:hypothetical protein
MKIINGKALLLRLRNPKQVVAAIPKSKEVEDSQVLVRWGVEEVLSLKKLNIKAPSPIEGKYSWTVLDYEQASVLL